MKVDNFMLMLMPLSRGSMDDATGQIPSHAERGLSKGLVLARGQGDVEVVRNVAV